MLRMRKHINGLYGNGIVFFFQYQQIAGLRGGITAYIYNFLVPQFP